MRVCLLFNPAAGSADLFSDIRSALAEDHTLTAIETHSANDLAQKAREAARGSFDVLAVAGGDGTIHAVVNALAPQFPPIRLAFLPLGTGNDFCRTLAVPLDATEATKIVRRHHGRRLDVIEMSGDVSGYLVNAATGGFSGRVAADVTSELKQFWGPFAYLRGAAGPVAELRTQTVTVRFDDNPPEEFDVLNLVIANGRTAAGGFIVAPLANPEDGFLDVVIVRGGDVLDLPIVASSLMAGDYLNENTVSHRRAKRVEIRSEEPIPFSFDGEQQEVRHVTFTVLPKRLRVLPGPDYRPNPTGDPVGHRTPMGWFFAALSGSLWLVARTIRQPAFLLAFVCLILFAGLTRGVVRGHWDEWNTAISRLVLETRTLPLDRFMLAVTHLGDPLPATLMAAALALGLLWQKRLAAAVGLLTVIVAIGGSELLIKPVFAVPRPDPSDALAHADGFGFPSGHALRSTALAAFLVLVVWRNQRWRWMGGVVVVALALLVVASRIYLGVHSLTDVLGGIVLSLFWVGIVAGIVHRWER